MVGSRTRFRPVCLQSKHFTDCAVSLAHFVFKMGFLKVLSPFAYYIFDSAIVKMLWVTNLTFFLGLFSLSQYLKTILGELIMSFL